MNQSNLYFATGNVVNTSNFVNNIGFFVATCDPGDRVLAGEHVVCSNTGNYVERSETFATVVTFADSYVLSIEGNNVNLHRGSIVF